MFEIATMSVEEIFFLLGKSNNYSFYEISLFNLISIAQKAGLTDGWMA